MVEIDHGVLLVSVWDSAAGCPGQHLRGAGGDQGVGDGLVAGDGLTKLHPLAGIVHRRLQQPLVIAVTARREVSDCLR